MLPRPGEGNAAGEASAGGGTEKGVKDLKEVSTEAARRAKSLAVCACEACTLTMYRAMAVMGERKAGKLLARKAGDGASVVRAIH
jgi:hypothetical protein